MTINEIDNIVRGFDRTHELGFTDIEKAILMLENFSDMNLSRYYDNMRVNTVGYIDDFCITYTNDFIDTIIYGYGDELKG